MRRSCWKKLTFSASWRLFSGIFGVSIVFLVPCIILQLSSLSCAIVFWSIYFCCYLILWSRPSEDRTIPLSVIAERTKLSIEDVEHLLMKSLSVSSLYWFVFFPFLLLLTSFLVLPISRLAPVFQVFKSSYLEGDWGWPNPDFHGFGGVLLTAFTLACNLVNGSIGHLLNEIIFIWYLPFRINAQRYT